MDKKIYMLLIITILCLTGCGKKANTMQVSTKQDKNSNTEIISNSTSQTSKDTEKIYKIGDVATIVASDEQKIDITVEKGFKSKTLTSKPIDTGYVKKKGVKQTAKGTFIFFPITIKNTGKVRATLFEIGSNLIEDDGTTYKLRIMGPLDTFTYSSQKNDVLYNDNSKQNTVIDPKFSENYLIGFDVADANGKFYLNVNYENKSVKIDIRN